MASVSASPLPPETLRKLAEHNMTPEEYLVALRILGGREPTEAEFGVIAAMWSEHCSYKSTRKWLRTFPTTGPQVLIGPGENAGVVDIGDGLAAVFKMESHNHPSYIEPYQGAATGVGGILRDVFTMGARPVANLNALRFGAPEHPRTRRLVAGVVAGIGGYGNCVGVPTVGGETNFHARYNGNCLVNCMTVGIASADRLFTAKAAGVGNPVVYVGSKTGRDGIKGATMASGEFNAGTESQRPTVQVGDPFTEKLLIEACLELMATDAIIAVQDMGAAGLTSSAVEMASRGGLGLDLDLDRVPLRAADMTAYEILLSESQERMLMVLRPDRAEEAERIFKKWELDCATIGTLTDTGRIVIRRHGRIEGDIEIAPLVENAPLYDRPYEVTPPRPALAPDACTLPQGESPLTVLVQLMGTPDLGSKRWIWEQYDRHVGADTAEDSSGGGDAAVVRVHGTGKALALTVDCSPRYVEADPVEGGKQAVAESWRNLCAVGARPLAITDNMNFGNPEKPLIMGQFVGAVQGMSEACRALDYPVVSGNCSLYNETDGEPILPTPVVGGVGLIEDVTRTATIAFKTPGEGVYVLGEPGTGHLGQSLILRLLTNREDGPPPPVDLAAERRAGDLIRALIAEGLITTCHDVSDGGLLVAVAEMALAGDIGCALAGPARDVGFWFGEDQARYVVTTRDVSTLTRRAEAAGVSCLNVGTTDGTASLTLPGSPPLTLAVLRKAYEGWLPGYMGGTE